MGGYNHHATGEEDGVEASVVVCLPLRPPRPRQPEKSLKLFETTMERTHAVRTYLPRGPPSVSVWGVCRVKGLCGGIQGDQGKIDSDRVPVGMYGLLLPWNPAMSSD